MEKFLDLLESFGVVVVQCASKRNTANGPFATFGNPPGDTSAVTLKTSKYDSDAHIKKMVIVERYGESKSLTDKPPFLGLAADILHEASHLILEDIKSSEDKGLAQLELLLSFVVSRKLWLFVSKSQEEDYFWDMGYDKVQQTLDWYSGIRKAMKVFNRSQYSYITANPGAAFGYTIQEFALKFGPYMTHR